MATSPGELVQDDQERLPVAAGRTRVGQVKDAQGTGPIRILERLVELRLLERVMLVTDAGRRPPTPRTARGGVVSPRRRELGRPTSPGPAGWPSPGVDVDAVRLVVAGREEVTGPAGRRARGDGGDLLGLR